MDPAPTSADSAASLLERPAEPGRPTTEYESKMVMLRAERGDRIQITDVRTRLAPNRPIPSTVSVTKRTTPYFGPKLRLTANEQAYLLTAPGPDTQLLLWERPQGSSQNRWTKLAEVTAHLDDDQPQYDLCPVCGEPMQTIEHQRKAAVGKCPGPEVSD